MENGRRPHGEGLPRPGGSPENDGIQKIQEKMASTFVTGNFTTTASRRRDLTEEPDHVVQARLLLF